MNFSTILKALLDILIGLGLVYFIYTIKPFVETRKYGICEDEEHSCDDNKSENCQGQIDKIFLGRTF